VTYKPHHVMTPAPQSGQSLAEDDQELPGGGRATACIPYRDRHADERRKDRARTYRAFITAVLEHTSAATAATRYRGLQQLFRWLVDEGKFSKSPMARMRQPKVDERPIPIVREHELRLLFATCRGRSFGDRRDEAFRPGLFAARGPKNPAVCATCSTAEHLFLCARLAVNRFGSHSVRTMPPPKIAAPRRKRHHCGEKGGHPGDCVRRMNHTGRTRIAVENLFTTPHPVRNLTC
jgi:hypothetical protein